MQISNKDVYFNNIYKAVVVNTNTGMDPMNANRVQIYIPSLQYKYNGVYKSYISDSNKESSQYKNKFPWAVSLVSDLKEGNIVYGGYIDNQVDSYIILGLDVYNAANNQQGAGGATGLNTSSVLNLVMPAIIMEETGYGKSQCPVLPSWPDDYPESIFTTIENVSGAPRGIGILQWTASRAFDLLYDIAKASNGSWESCWSDKSIDLYKQIKNAITAGSTQSYRNSNAMCSSIAYNGPQYIGVKNMLQLDASRTVQTQKAPEETMKAIEILQSDPYNISNPGIIIFYADIMNQYGNGVNNHPTATVLRGCITYAAQVDKSSSDLMTQVTQVYNDWKARTSFYSDRRSRIYSYIKWLNEQGKLQLYNLVDSGYIEESKYIPEVGEYLWPLLNSDQINCYYGYYNDGDRDANKRPYNFNYNYAHIHYGSFHYGVDFGPKKVGVDGDPVIAVGSGTVAYVCSPAAGQSGGQGGCIILRMDKNPQHYFAYMHLCKKPEFNVGDKVKAGQIVGYMGTTGNSTGTHLHLGLHIGAAWAARDEAHRVDPLPHLGKKASS